MWKKIFVFLLVLVVLAYPAVIASATTYYVNGACGSDAWSGLSSVCSDPNGPKATISAGIAAAANGDTVIVADGTYSGANNANLSFAGKAITLRSENGPNSTTIDIIGLARGFVFGSGEEPDSILDGFLIQNAYLSQGNGAGIYILNSSPTIRNCKIKRAIAFGYPTYGGGMYIENQTANPNGEKIRITNCEFLQNFAGYYGGAIYIGPNNNREVVIDNCKFLSNGASPDIEMTGGAIYAESNSSLTIIANSTFYDNQTLYWGGAIYSAGLMKVVNCLFYANKTTDYNMNEPDYAGGGAIAVRDGTFEMSNSTLVSNSSYTEGGGSMVVELAGTASISNTIFWNDSPYSSGFVVSGPGSNASLIYCDLSTNPYAVTYFGGVVNLGAGIMYSDPLFKDIGNNDYHLGDASPLIDVGGNNSVMSDVADLDGDSDVNEPTPFDLDGNPRIFNQVVDMGAYEIGMRCPLHPAGDVNGDCMVDFVDFAILAGSWLQCNAVPQSECAPE